MVADRGAGEALRQQQRKSGRRRLAPTSRRRAQNNRAHHARSTDNPLASRSAQVFELKKIKATVMSVGSQILLLGGPGWGRGGTFFSGHTLHTNVHTSGTHLATRPLSSSARAGRGAAAGRHSVESHSTGERDGGTERTTMRAEPEVAKLRRHPPTGPASANCAHATTRATGSVPPPSSASAVRHHRELHCVRAPKQRRRPRMVESVVNVQVHTLPARVQIARARVRSDTPPYPYDDRFNTFGCDLCLFTVRGGRMRSRRVTLRR